MTTDRKKMNTYSKKLDKTYMYDKTYVFILARKFFFMIVFYFGIFMIKVLTFYVMSYDQFLCLYKKREIAYSESSPFGRFEIIFE